MSNAGLTVEDEDEFADLSWPDFTESELEFADPPPGGWRLEDTEDEAEPVNAQEDDDDEDDDDMVAGAVGGVLKRAARKIKPPMTLRRPRKAHFSVTELISVSWCELQIDYGLRHKRDYLPVEKRAPTIVTREGKTITVKNEVAVERSQRLEIGVKVHKKLEREIQPKKEVIVHASNREESWAARLIEMVSALDTLDAMDACRELPVFGFVQDELVLGCIDEIVRQSSRSLSPATQTARTVSVGQTTLDKAFSPRKNKAKKLYLIDNKSRGTATLPHSRDVLPAHLQLMLYHRLLSNLLFPPVAEAGSTSSPQYDFARLWRHVNVNPSLPFKSKFLQDLGQIGDADLRCLEDVVGLWNRTVESLRRSIRGINGDLEVVYRTRAKTAVEQRRSEQENEVQSKGKRKHGRAGHSDDGAASDTSGRKRLRSKSLEADTAGSPTGASAQFSEEEQQLQRAIALSLAPLGDVEDADLQRAIAASLSVQPATVSSDLALLQDNAEDAIPRLPDRPLLANGERDDTEVHDDDIAPTAVSVFVEQHSNVVLANAALETVDVRVPLQVEERTSSEHSIVLNEVEDDLMPERRGESDVDVGVPQFLSDTTQRDTDMAQGHPKPESILASMVDPDAADDSVVSITAGNQPLDGQGVETGRIKVHVPAQSTTATLESSNGETSDRERKARSQKSKQAVTSRTYSNTAVIGVKLMHYNGAMLDTFLERALAYWHGQRKPEGVSIEDIGRCGSCEYKNGCEWRERKAEEHVQAARARSNGARKPQLAAEAP